MSYSPINVRHALPEDLPLVLDLLGVAQAKDVSSSQGLLTLDTVGQLDLLVQREIADPDQAYFIAESRDGSPLLLLEVTHLKKAPPVYDPQRSVLCLKDMVSTTQASVEVAIRVIDEAARWSLEKSENGQLLLSSVTWCYDKYRKNVIEEYAARSELRNDSRFNHLFSLREQPADFSTATRWYFGSLSRISGDSTRYVRRANKTDVPEMVALSKAKRLTYAERQPVFWRTAQDGDRKQHDYFAELIANEKFIVLVAERTKIEGFIIGCVRDTLPMMRANVRMRCGLHIDDFALSNAAAWSEEGRALMGALLREHRVTDPDEATINVVAGDHDVDKCDLLEKLGMKCLYTWQVLPGG